MKNIILTEIKLRSTDWANISDRYYDRDGIGIQRGKTGAEGQAGPSQGNVTLQNKDGALAPRNPNSPIFGQFGRNTPIRFTVVKDPATFGLVLQKASTGRAEAVDSAGISIIGDLDVRLDLELLPQSDPDPRWQWPTAGFDLASKWEFHTGNLSWSWLLIGGKLQFNWSSTGAAGISATCPSVLAAPNLGRRALRTTIDVDNGAAGRTITFYQGPTLAGPWTQIGQVIQAGVTSIFDNTQALRVGAAPNADAWTWGGSGPVVCYGFELRSGINGTVVASSDYTAQILDPNPFGVGVGLDGTWNDAQGNHWFPQGTPDAARIWYGKIWSRYVGESAEWPPRWDPSHRDKYVPVVANGILRRLGQGKSPIKTGLRDFILRSDLVDALASYYPLEGAEGTTYSLNLAPANFYYLSTRFSPQAVFANGNVFQSPVFTYGKDMGASWIGSGMELNATGFSFMRGEVATGDPNVALDFVWQSPSLGVLTVQIVDYTGNTWDVVLDTPTNDGTLQVHFNDPNVGPIGFLTVGPFTELQDANLHHLRFQLTQSGADTQFAVYIDGTLRSSGTMAGYVLNGWATYNLLYTRYVNQTVMNIAHLAAWANASVAQIPPIADTVLAAFGYAGETAAARITRLCTEGGIPLVIIGAPAATTVMGPQVAEARLAAIRDGEATDFGILTEQRDDNGLLYRTRVSQYNQTGLTIDYATKVVAPPFEPTDDDQATRNDVTASRRDGGSFNLTLPTGPMSVQGPPLGIGQYEDEITVNVQTDAQLPSAAGWWLSLGTLDAARFPSVTFNLGAQEIQDNPALMDAILALEVGDRLPITNIDAADIPDDVDLIVQGYNEQITNSTWTITFNCAPGAPYQVGKFGTSRFDAKGSTLTAAVTNVATSMQFTSLTTSALWTTQVSAFPFDVNVAGERVTVTGITGASSPQTATVVRSVNGVIAAHAAGTPVSLWDTPRFAY